MTLGHGPSTIGRGGCLLTCLEICRRELLKNGPADVSAANKRCLAADAFAQDRLIVEKAASALGLDAPSADRVYAHDADDAHLASALVDAVTKGLAILHVDHDSGKPNGDASGDHFIVAVAKAADWVQCLDPACGRVVLDFPSLRGLATWGNNDIRKYRVVSLIPVRVH